MFENKKIIPIGGYYRFETGLSTNGISYLPLLTNAIKWDLRILVGK